MLAYILPEDDISVSKHVGVYIHHKWCITDRISRRYIDWNKCNAYGRDI